MTHRNALISSSSRNLSAAIAMFLMIFLPGANSQENEKSEYSSAAQSLRDLPTKLHKVSFHFESRGLTHLDNMPYLHASDLKWDLTNGHFYCRTVKYADIEGREPRHIVVNTWDGKDAFYWVRYVDKTRSGKGMLGNEPEDPGVVIRFPKGRTGDFCMIQEFMFPELYGKLKENEVRAEARPHDLKGNFPEGGTTHLIDKYRHLIVHLPSGWLLKFSMLDGNGKTVVDSLVSDFATVPSTTIIFPTKLLRTTDFDSLGENTSLLTIDPASIKIGDAVSIPELDLPPGVHFQKE
jgi:hypothetical protein